jgi:hypothetical protein
MMSCRDTRSVHLHQVLDWIMGMPAEFSNFRTLEIFKRGPPTSGNHLHRAHILIKLVLSISWLVEPDQGGSKY